MTETVINPAAWKAAMKEVAMAPLPDEHPDAVTVTQFCALMGLSSSQGRRRLADLHAAGRAERVIKYLRVADGTKRKVSAYRLTPKRKKDK